MAKSQNALDPAIGRLSDPLATIILAIFGLVILVEQASAWLRRRVM